MTLVRSSASASGSTFGRAASALHRKPPTAHGPLALVEVFVNSRGYSEALPDQLADEASLRHWLKAHGLVGDDAVVMPSDVVLAIELREALRALLLANTTGTQSPLQAVEVLNRLGALAPLSPTFDGAQVRFGSSNAGVAGALARLLSVVAVSMVEGSWPNLKACRSESCRAAFFDMSRNHSGQWCTPQVCGVRERAAAFRSRHRRGGS